MPGLVMAVIVPTPDEYAAASYPERRRMLADVHALLALWAETERP